MEVTSFGNAERLLILEKENGSLKLPQLTFLKSTVEALSTDEKKFK